MHAHVLLYYLRQNPSLKRSRSLVLGNVRELKTFRAKLQCVPNQLNKTEAFCRTSVFQFPPDGVHEPAAASSKTVQLLSSSTAAPLFVKENTCVYTIRASARTRGHFVSMLVFEFDDYHWIPSQSAPSRPRSLSVTLGRFYWHSSISKAVPLV